MLYNLSNGKTIELTFEQWFNMTDEDEEYLLAFGHGEETNSIWKGSSLEHVRNQETDDIEDIIELPDITIDERLNDEEFLKDD